MFPSLWIFYIYFIINAYFLFPFIWLSWSALTCEEILRPRRRKSITALDNMLMYYV